MPFGLHSFHWETISCLLRDVYKLKSCAGFGRSYTSRLSVVTLKVAIFTDSKLSVLDTCTPHLMTWPPYSPTDRYISPNSSPDNPWTREAIKIAALRKLQRQMRDSSFGVVLLIVDSSAYLSGDIAECFPRHFLQLTHSRVSPPCTTTRIGLKSVREPDNDKHPDCFSVMSLSPEMENRGDPVKAPSRPGPPNPPATAASSSQTIRHTPTQSRPSSEEPITRTMATHKSFDSSKSSSRGSKDSLIAKAPTRKPSQEASPAPPNANDLVRPMMPLLTSRRQMADLWKAPQSTQERVRYSAVLDHLQDMLRPSLRTVYHRLRSHILLYCELVAIQMSLHSNLNSACASHSSHTLHNLVPSAGPDFTTLQHLPSW